MQTIKDVVNLLVGINQEFNIPIMLRITRNEVDVDVISRDANHEHAFRILWNAADHWSVVFDKIRWAYKIDENIFIVGNGHSFNEAWLDALMKLNSQDETWRKRGMIMTLMRCINEKLAIDIVLKEYPSKTREHTN